MRVLVTGAAGFIGSKLSHTLLDRGDHVLGLDNLNAYYDPKLKEDRLKLLQERPGFSFEKVDISDRIQTERIFRDNVLEVVVNLAAQAGVRYSLENPYAYTRSNIDGFLNILEGCRHRPVKHLVFASSSSVYGANKELPFSVSHNVDHPISLYAATKKANELMAHTYSYLYQVPATGLRFFTVYGPWGRPDMALFQFTQNILKGQPIKVFNYGHHKRDFTYIDDIVEGVVRVIDRPPPISSGEGNSSEKHVPYNLFNIGNSSPVLLMDFIAAIEKALGKKAIIEFLALQPGDVPDTYADVTSLEEWTGFRPKTSVGEGIARFVEWYRSYFRV